MKNLKKLKMIDVKEDSKEWAYLETLHKATGDLNSFKISCGNYGYWRMTFAEVENVIILDLAFEKVLASCNIKRESDLAFEIHDLIFR